MNNPETLRDTLNRDTLNRDIFIAALRERLAYELDMVASSIHDDGDPQFNRGVAEGLRSALDAISETLSQALNETLSQALSVAQEGESHV